MFVNPGRGGQKFIHRFDRLLGWRRLERFLRWWRLTEQIGARERDAVLLEDEVLAIRLVAEIAPEMQQELGYRDAPG